LLLCLLARAPAQAPEGNVRKLTEVPAIDEQGGDDRWAVVVGVSKYKYPGIDLEYPADDARAMAQTLQSNCGFPQDHIKLLVDEDATAINVRTAIGTWLTKVAGRRDLVVIYFSGHGAPDLDPNISEDGIRKYLVCHDSDPTNLFATAIPMEDLSSALLRVRSERTVVFLDSCYSGSAEPAGHDGSVRTFERPGVDVTGKLKSGFIDTLALSGRGRAVMTACDPDGESWEYNDIHHGIFTYYLLQGLAGAAADPSTGQVDVNGLYDYVYQHLQNGGPSRRPQTPILATSVMGELVLAGTGITQETETATGTLEITSSPLGAQVFLDQDTTPLTTPLTKSLPTGLHHLAIYKPGYLPITDDVAVSGFRPNLQSYVLDQEELKGDVLVIAPSGTHLTFDSQDAGTIGQDSLLRIPDVAAAAHTIRADAAGYKSQELKVTVDAGRPSIVRFTLEKTLAGLRSATAADMPAGLMAAGDNYVWTKDNATMVFVSEGSFWMGSDDIPSAAPRHEVTLPAFWIDRCEVTNAQFAAFVSDSGYHVRGGWTVPAPDHMRRPATHVTLDDARAYAAWAGKRLPTEAEWEKAARGTDGRIYPYGNELDALCQNIRAYGLNDTMDVGSLPNGASPYGALDMLGNVWEWCDSAYNAYPGNASPDPNMGKGFSVIRGGSYLSPALKDDVAVPMRAFLLSNLSQEDVGFRCVVNAP